ncbi:MULTISPECIES: alpha/beta fold hydrolase [Actinomadura]|uniref:Pimeloyl-ACP methyl ester carboxylesterase n=1 Tax=Actinomadura madurae TaxID=1993 RepID=A0A1I5JSE0_9ACTN|nr:alpha/beta hydrolase [Actinomadura madurae]SFO75675.1 Pimeloyl-ACP methyl ester carboxylesterase [Actinomadura madurae]
METVHSKDGTRIAIDRTGTGPAVVHVGGALNDRGSGAALAELLAPVHTVLTYDRRGRGDSGDTPPYAVEREIEDLAAVIEAAGGSAAVYGMSSGAVLALRAAAHGLPITRLALFEPPFNPAHDDHLTRARAYHTELTGLLADDRRGDALALFMTNVGMPAEMVGQMRHAPMWPALEALAPTLAYDSAVMDDAATGAKLPEDLLARVTVPALVLDGGESPDWMRDTARRAAALLPAGSHRTLDGQTHDVAPAVLAPVLADFLAA